MQFCYHFTQINAGHPQDYDGKTFYFVDKPAEGVICVVCRALAHNPVQATCCGKIYCAQCIKKWKTRSKSCPTCRSKEESSPPFNVFPDRRAYQDVSTLAVFCPNWKDGCSKKMELAEVDNHLTSDNGCLFQVVDCSNKCGHSVWRACMFQHISECPLRRMKCQYCPFISFHEQVTGDHLKECPNYPFECPRKCGAQSLTRSTVLTHQEVCPLQQVECEYKRFGCAVYPSRKDMKRHLQTSVESHLRLTKKKVEEQEVQLREVEERAERGEVQLREAARERQRMNETIAHLVDRVEQLELK